MTVYVVVIAESNQFMAAFGTFLAALRYVSKYDIDYCKIVPVGIAR